MSNRVRDTVFAVAVALVAACGDDREGARPDAGTNPSVDASVDAAVDAPPRACSLASDCDDDNECTTDACNGAGECENTPVVIDDSIVCTMDACDPSSGEVTHTTVDARCDANATCSPTLDCVCDDGFTGDGLTCTPTNTTVACDALANPANGSVTTSNNGNYPSTATYACNSGYELSSTTPRTCGMDGTWSGAAPTCTAITFFVVRVGDGSAALAGASTATFLEERDATGAVVRTIALPTAATGANAPFTLHGTATAEGGLSRSDDGRYLTLGGYAVAPGVAMINSSRNLSTDTTPVNRVVARVAADGTVDTTTRLVNAFSESSIRGVASSDGTAFWATGNSGPGATGGVHYVTLGSTGPTVRVSGTVNNLRHAHVFGGQLYVSSASGNATRGVLAVGNGLPTAADTVAAQIAPFPSTLSANSFAVLDLNPVVVGPDTVYVAFDQGGVIGTANIQKWTYDGTTWAQATFAPVLASTTVPNALGLTTWLEGTSVHIVLTTAESPARIVKIVDDGTSPAPVASVLVSAEPNTAFRGVARSPRP